MAEPKPKILYLVTQLSWGGAQRYLSDLIPEAANRYTVTLAVGADKKGRAEPNNLLLENLKKTAPGLQIVRLKHLVRPVSLWHDLSAVRELHQLYEKLKPDIVHANSSKAGVIASLARWRLGQRQTTRDTNGALVYTVHGWVFTEPLGRLRQAIYRYLEKITLKDKNKIIVLSEAEKKLAAELGARAEQLICIPHGITAYGAKINRHEAREKILALLNIKPNGNEIWLGCVANFYKTKGVDVLFTAIEKLLCQNPPQNFKLIVIGDGPERPRLEAKIKSANLEPTVHLLGFVASADELLPAFDLLVMPSRKEGFPYIMLEAAASGVPILATAVGGVPEFIENKVTGLLVPPENTTALAEAINYAVSHPEELVGWAKAAQKKAQGYTLERMVAATLGVYDQFIANSFESNAAEASL